MKKIKDKELMTLNLMAEENTLHTLHQNDINEITYQEIEQAQQDPKFYNFIEKILEKDT